MEVFEYGVNDLFTIKASTSEIYLPWKKFRARINEPSTYCAYDSNVDGALKLFDYESGKPEIVDKESWNSTRPVFYESNSYTFTIYLNNVKEGTEPRIIHPDKRVSEMFNAEHIGNKAFLSGAINFLNEPGRFCLKFAYTLENGVNRVDEVSFDVVSPKLDTKEDLKTIIKEIRAEYDDLVFRYLTLTYQQFASGHEANNDVIWLAVFKQIIRGYLTAVRYIVHKPHFRDVHHTEYRHAERIKKWTPDLAEKFVNDFAEDKEKALQKMYRYQQTETTEDTRENRFVKYTIGRISERLQQILRRIKSVKEDNVSTDESIELESYIRELEKLKRNSLFKSIGRFEGFRQESIVLQQRTGYAQVYRYWLMLQNGLDLVDGRTAVGVLPIWQLYEVWCFLKMKRIVRNILHIDTKNPDDLQYIHEKTSSMFNPFSDSEMSDSVIYDNKENGDQIELGYQYRYDIDSEYEGVYSATVEQKPDIVMNIHKHNPDIMLTYLFDAKYRVQGDDDPNVKDDVEDKPVQDTLNQMHRYRDAIYYGDSKRRNMSKEVIGAYILFPGRLNEAKVQQLIDSGDWENKSIPYYIRSIHQVNIGAYPLLPNEESGILLKRQVESVINKESVKEQLIDSIPQRGLFYTTERPQAHDIVLFGCVRDDAQWQWIKEHGWYNVRLQVYGHEREGGMPSTQKLLSARHFVLYKFIDENIPTVEVSGIFDLQHYDEAPMFFDGMEMNKNSINYPRRVNPFYRYLIYQIDMNKPSDFSAEPSVLKFMIEQMQKEHTVGKDRGIVELRSVYELFSNIITEEEKA